MKNLKNKLFYIYSAVLYAVLLIIFSVISLIYIENYAADMLLSTFAANKNYSEDIIEVIIDDYSVEKYKWPWSKDKLADILDFFDTYSKPTVVGLDLDITYSPNPIETDMRFIKKIKSMKNVVVGFIPEILNADTDKDMLPEFQKRYALDVDLTGNMPLSPYNGVNISKINFENPTPNYGSVLAGVGRSENILDNGNIFDYGNIILVKDAFYPSLAFKMYLVANGTNKVTINSENIVVDKTNLKLPYVYKSGLLKSNIRYYQPFEVGGEESSYSHISISASTILDTYYAMKSGITPKNHPQDYEISAKKYLNPKLFNNKMIFVGGNISGPTADVLKTPMNYRHPGVDIQATILDNLMNFHQIKYSTFNVNLACFLILCLLSFIFIMRLKIIKGFIALIILDILYLIAVCISAYNGYIMYYATPIVCQFVTAIFAYSFKFISENRNKELIKNAMGKYLSRDIMQNVVKNIDDIKLGGKRAVVTVLFSDIRGFTSMSEKMSAEEVSSILNEYFAEMEPIISKYNGVINKFIGDAIMAIFGEPIQDDNHPQNAVKCAYEMLKRVSYLREKWLSEGKAKFEIGVGINTGEVFIGNIGTESRMEYTVIGDTVNLASRIESYNKVYKTNLLVSSSTYSYISDIADVIKIKEVQIRGKAKKMDIYEVLRIQI